MVSLKSDLEKKTTQLKRSQNPTTFKSDLHLHKGETNLVGATRKTYGSSSKSRKKEIHQQIQQMKKEPKVKQRKAPRRSFSSLGDVRCFNYQKLWHAVANWKNIQQKKQLDRSPYQANNLRWLPTSQSSTTIMYNNFFMVTTTHEMFLATRMLNASFMQRWIK